MSDYDIFDRLVANEREQRRRQEKQKAAADDEEHRQAARVRAYGQYAAQELLAAHIPTDKIYQPVPWQPPRSWLASIFTRPEPPAEPKVLVEGWKLEESGTDKEGYPTSSDTADYVSGTILCTDGNIRGYHISSRGLSQGTRLDNPVEAMSGSAAEHLMAIITNLIVRHVPEESANE